MENNNIIIKKSDSFDDVLHFQIDIIKQNTDLPVFLPLLKLKEDVLFFEIDTTGYIPLEERLKTISKTNKNLIILLDKFFKAISICDRYFLDIQNISPGFCGIYITSKGGNSLTNTDNLMFVYYPLASDHSPFLDPIKAFCEEFLIRFESHRDIDFNISRIKFLENAEISNINGLYDEFKKYFPDGEINKTRELFNPVKNILKDTLFLPGVIMSQLFLVYLSFTVLKRHMNFENSKLSFSVVFLCVIICFLMDIWLIFSRSSPLKINPISFSKKMEQTQFSKFNKTANLTSIPPKSEGYEKSLKYSILTEDFLIGSDSTKSDLVLNFSFIDEMHARIFNKSGLFFIEDLGSSAGTYLNDMKLKKFSEYKLSENSKLKFGEAVFYFSLNS